jgi:hypothetical protein
LSYFLSVVAAEVVVLALETTKAEPVVAAVF